MYVYLYFAPPARLVCALCFSPASQFRVAHGQKKLDHGRKVPKVQPTSLDTVCHIRPVDSPFSLSHVPHPRVHHHCQFEDVDSRKCRCCGIAPRPCELSLAITSSSTREVFLVCGAERGSEQSSNAPHLVRQTWFGHPHCMRAVSIAVVVQVCRGSTSETIHRSASLLRWDCLGGSLQLGIASQNP